MRGRSWRTLAAVAAVLAALVAYPHPERESPAPRRSSVWVTDAFDDALLETALESDGVLLPYRTAPGALQERRSAGPARPTPEDVRRVRGDRAVAQLWIAVERAGTEARALVVTSPASDLSATRARGTLSPELCELWSTEFAAGETPTGWAPATSFDSELVAGGAPEAAWGESAVPPGWTMVEGDPTAIGLAAGTDERPGGFVNGATRPARLRQKIELPPAREGRARELVLDARVAGEGASVSAILADGGTLLLTNGAATPRTARVGEGASSLQLELHLPAARPNAPEEERAAIAGISLIVRSKRPSPPARPN